MGYLEMIIFLDTSHVKYSILFKNSYVLYEEEIDAVFHKKQLLIEFHNIYKIMSSFLNIILFLLDLRL